MHRDKITPSQQKPHANLVIYKAKSQNSTSCEWFWGKKWLKISICFKTTGQQEQTLTWGLPQQRTLWQNTLRKARENPMAFGMQGFIQHCHISTSMTQKDSLPFLIYICVKENRLWPLEKHLILLCLWFLKCSSFVHIGNKRWGISMLCDFFSPIPYNLWAFRFSYLT